MIIQRYNTIEELVKGMMLGIELPGIREVDNGIGAYEYWGSKGVDVQLDGELEELEDVRLELTIPKGHVSLTSANFSDFIAGLIFEVDEAAHELEFTAKQKYREGLDDESSKPVHDYSDIIKLCYVVDVMTFHCSVEIFKVMFTFTWCDAREV
jgi:hypothetical protein